jgi:hypothetical protein
MVSLRHLMCDFVLAGLVCAAPTAFPQSTSSTAVTVPRYMSFTGQLKNQEGKPAEGRLIVTFVLFDEESGGSPLWSENHRLTLDSEGRYTVTLGANTAGGVPGALFAANNARWLAVEPEGLPIPPRVLLVSVPYAFKAGDAQTLGGLPPSAFMAAPAAGAQTGPGIIPIAPVGVTIPPAAGTTSFVPLWFPNGSTLGNSALYQSGIGTASLIGINTTAPQATLDVTGGAIVRGLLRLPFQVPATVVKGTPSPSLVFQASAYSSITQMPVSPKFQWTAVPNGNNSDTPRATLDLAYGTTSVTPTGLSIGGNGQITFAPGQSFPGTITGVTAGTGLSGGGTSGPVTLSLNTSYSDGRYAQLAANNTYAGVQYFKNLVGFGLSNPAYPLHVNGMMRAETGLSLGGNAVLGVDSPGVIGGHLLVDGAGKVGINNPAPQSALDVNGNINASGSLTGSLVNATGGVKIGSDAAMGAAPRMYLTGYVRGPMAANELLHVMFTVPTKNIIITRILVGSFNPCFLQGDLIFQLQTNLGFIASLAVGRMGYTDSGPLSLEVTAGSWLYGELTAPNCGFGAPLAPADIPISVEYIMR